MARSPRPHRVRRPVPSSQEQTLPAIAASVPDRGPVGGALLLLLLLGISLLAAPGAAAQDSAPFITTWETTSADESITIPTDGGADKTDYDFQIDWGDGTSEPVTGDDPDPSHTYSSAGTHVVSITGTFPHLYLNDGSSAPKLQTVEQWGAIQWESMEAAFAGAENVTSNATDAPDLTGVTSTHEMFKGASSFNGDIGGWDVSSVSNMEAMFLRAESFNQDLGGWSVGNVTTVANMFAGASAFNGDIGAWDVSSVNDMDGMFYGASVFNQDIGDWNVSNVTDMARTFRDAEAFNQDIGGWDVSSVTRMASLFLGAESFNRDIGEWSVSSVTNMLQMFEGADAFNQDIGAWDVSSVHNMEDMFLGTDAFNQDIGHWDVSSVTDMSGMFSGADAFNQDIGGWDVSNVTDMRGMFESTNAFDQDISGWDVSSVTEFGSFLQGTSLSVSNYDALLIGWAHLSLQVGLTFDAGNSRYTSVGESARQAITNDHNWTISDGGKTEEISVAVDRSFDGATESTDYRLVALPGQVDRFLADAVSGEAGTGWQAYYDDGSESDFFLKFDGSDSFHFQPGNGFWLTVTSNWTLTDSFSRVGLRNDSSAVIGLREGWNVISNPLGEDRTWSEVQAAHSGSLQPLWTFDRAFARADTFRSAREGLAYYFFNDSADRDSLVIPYLGVPSGGKTTPTAALEQAQLLALTASRANGDDGPSSTIRVGIEPNTAVGLGPEDLIAPPSRFAETSLRIEAPGASESKRTQALMAEQRPPATTAEGHTFALRLTSTSGGPIQLTATNLDAVGDRAVALLRPAAGQSHDLRDEPSVRVTPNGSATELKVAVGSKAYVEGERQKVLPDEVQLTSYPNPMRRQGTVEYALPEKTDVTLRVYDILGRRVATLARGQKEAGRHTVQLQSRRLSSGVYFGRLHAGGETRTLKMTIVR